MKIERVIDKRRYVHDIIVIKVTDGIYVTHLAIINEILREVMNSEYYSCFECVLLKEETCNPMCHLDDIVDYFHEPRGFMNVSDNIRSNILSMFVAKYITKLAKYENKGNWKNEGKR